jgi:hypothetical protein
MLWIAKSVSRVNCVNTEMRKLNGWHGACAVSILKLFLFSLLISIFFSFKHYWDFNSSLLVGFGLACSVLSVSFSKQHDMNY